MDPRANGLPTYVDAFGVDPDEPNEEIGELPLMGDRVKQLGGWFLIGHIRDEDSWYPHEPYTSSLTYFPVFDSQQNS